MTSSEVHHSSSDAIIRRGNTRDLELSIEDLNEKIFSLTERLDHIEAKDISRIDLLEQKIDESVRDTAKAIKQLTEALEAQKDKFKNALTATHNLDTRSLNDFKKNHAQQISTITSSIQSLKDEIDKLKISPPVASSSTQSSGDNSSLLARLELLENKTTTRNEEVNRRIEDVAQDVKNNTKMTEELGLKIDSFDTQYSLDCQQRREHDTEFDSELSKIKLSIEAFDTEIKNQVDLITQNFHNQFLDKFNRLDSADKKLSDFDTSLKTLNKKIDDQNNELKEMINVMKEQITTNCKAEIQQTAEEQRKDLEQLIKEQAAAIDTVQLEENGKIDDLKSQLDLVSSFKDDLLGAFEETKQSLKAIVDSSTEKVETGLTNRINDHNTKIDQLLNDKEEMEKYKNETTSRIDSLNNLLKKNEIELQQDIDDFNSKMRDIQVKTGSVTSEASQNLQNQIDQIKKEQDDQQKLINDLSTKQDDSQSSVQHGIEPRLVILESQLSQLKSSSVQKEDFDKTLIDHKGEIDSQIGQLKTEIQQSINGVKTNLSTEDNSLDDLKNQLNALNGQIQELTSAQKSLPLTISQDDFAEHVKKNDENINELKSRIEELTQSNNQFKSMYETQESDLKSRLILVENQMKEIQDKNKDILSKSEAEQNELKSQLEVHLSELQDKITNEVKSKLDSLDQISTESKEIKLKVESLDTEVKSFKDEYQKNVDSTADIIADTVNSIKTSHDQISSEIEEIRNQSNTISDRVQDLEDKFGEVQETSNTCMTNFNELNSTMYDKFVTSDALESLNVKRKNFEDQFRNIVGELNTLIETEKSERTHNVEEITQQLTDIQSAITDMNSKAELSSSYTKEQIRRVYQLVQSPQGENGQGGGVTASPEMIEELNELQYKVRLMEEGNSKFKDEIVTINKSLIDVKNDIKKYEKLISDQEFVNNRVHDDILERVSGIETRITETFEKLEDLPKMVHKASDDNQMAINELSHHVEEKLRDFDSQMKQADFADEEIEELRKQFEANNEHSKLTTVTINERLEKNEKEIEKRKSAEDELSKIWSAIKDNKLKIDVQLDRTNPQFSQLIQELRMKVFPQEEMSKVSQIQLPENSADIEMLKAKVNQLEEDLRNTTLETTHLKDDISTTQDNLERASTQMKNDFQDNNKKLNEMFVNQETFNSMKKEVQTIFNLLNTTIENSEAHKENLEEEMNCFRTDFQNVRNEIQSVAANGPIPQKEQTHEVKPTAEIGAGKVSSSASFTDKQKGSDKRFGELQQKMEGIESALQQQIRKLKSSIRKIEKAFEDAEEEEIRQQEIERQKKLKEEEERRRKEEEDMMEEEFVDDIAVDTHNQQIVSTGSQNLIRSPEAIVYIEGGDSTEVEKLPQKFGAFMTTVKLPTAVELIQDDFQIFFVLMFSVLLYFLISDLFLS